MASNVTVAFCEGCRGTDFAERRCTGHEADHGKFTPVARPPRLCLRDGCGQKLHDTNKSGLCLAHYMELHTPPVIRCTRCGHPMRHRSLTGLCQTCYQAQWKVAEVTKRDAQARDRCLYPGCAARVKRGSPLCRVHRLLAKSRRCSYPGCWKPLDLRNKMGRCKEHYTAAVAEIALREAEAHLARQGRFMAAMRVAYVRLEVPYLDADVFAALRAAVYGAAGRTPPELDDGMRRRVLREVHGG